MDGDEEIRSDDGSATPVQDEQEDARPESRQSEDDGSDNEDAAHDRKSENADSGSDHEARGGGDGSDSEPEPPRPADSEEDEEGSSPVKRRASTSDMEEEEKTQPASDSEQEETEKRRSPKSDAGSDSDEDKPKQKTQRDSDAEEEEQEEEGGRKEEGKWKAVMNSDSEDEEERPKQKAGSDEDEGPKRRALASDDEDEKPVKRKKAVLSDSDEDEDKEVKKSRLVSDDDDDSGSDEGSGGPDKSLAAKLKELGSDSEDEEDMKRDAGKKDEKALFGSDSDSGDDEEEKMIADIFGESGDEEEEEFTGFNQEELEAERPQSQALGQKGLENDSDSDDDVDRGGKDMSFMSDFDIMLARKKAQSGKRRRNRDGGTFISDADDVVSAMITKMTEAAEEDRTLNSQKKPALKKLMLLPTVVMHLKKQDLKETFIDSGVMTAIKEWISPLPDKSLPALKIREELLKILQELPSVSQETLKLSGIGRAVMYLYKHPKESRPNKDLALKLINEWSRPIFGLSSNYKGMTREERQQRDLDQQIAPRRRLSEPQTSERQEEPDVFAPALSSGGQTPRRDLEKVLTGEEKALRPGDPGFCARARVPMPSNKDYVVRPKWNVDGDSSRAPLKKGLSRVDKQMRRFADIKRLTKPGHAVKISVEGNRMPL
ncbi:protein IWS1 homolog isoform X1 [Labeo rohita]|uniref:protein IWS1 homolog isoform X1 n=1 Tax=Labeo rohita TaxID=84645 RepID=UPI0021E283D5|nr:protein IWS1 homolog isoform X1 [Labeo rohita]